MQTQTGTPYYASPEVWRDQPYDYKCDIWSLGCVIYELAAQRPPFMARDMKGLFNKVTSGIFPNIPSRFSGELYLLISKMLTVDPNLRPSAEQLLSLDIIKKRFPFNLAVSNNILHHEIGDTFEELEKQESQCNLGEVRNGIESCEVQDNSESFEGVKLIDTIRMPKNIKQLTERLPKSNYGDEKKT